MYLLVLSAVFCETIPPRFIQFRGGVRHRIFDVHAALAEVKGIQRSEDYMGWFVERYPKYVIIPQSPSAFKRRVTE